jgi:GNAT superfamily N-acetyltransferase
VTAPHPPEATTAAVVSIRPLSLDDLAEADRLRELAGFNQNLADWRRLLEWAPHGCFAAESDHRLVGTVTTTPFGHRLAWIGMMLVDPGQRRRGIGRTLMGRALEATRDVECVALDATPLGKTLYDQLGFVQDRLLVRWRGVVTAPPRSTSTPIRPMTADDLPAVAALDRTAAGVDRFTVLQSLFDDPRGRCVVTDDLSGFGMSRPGAAHHAIGPVIARTLAVAPSVIDALLAPLVGSSVVLDTPDPTPLAELLTSRGLSRQRPFVRMSRGPLPPGDADLTYAIIGPEVG